MTQTSDETEFLQTLVTVDTARQRLGRALFLDVRHQLSDPDWGKNTYREGHVPGALFVHLDRDLASEPTGRNGRHPLPAREDFLARLAAWGVDERRQIIIYDQGDGKFAARLWWMLRKWLGFGNAAVLNGGYAAWTQAGHAVATGDAVGAMATAATPVPATADEAGRAIVVMAEVRANINARRFQVVDARAASRFRGDVEPVDPVAGHIPGAVNRPFADNLDDNGLFKRPEVLRREWLQVLADRDAAA